jgi:hypothetical protein
MEQEQVELNVTNRNSGVSNNEFVMGIFICAHIRRGKTCNSTFVWIEIQQEQEQLQKNRESVGKFVPSSRCYDNTIKIRYVRWETLCHADSNLSALGTD